MPVVFVHEGAAIDYTPGVAVPAGAVVVQGDLVGVTRLDIPAGRLGALAVEGVFDFPKLAGDGYGLALGQLLYWDAAQQVATATAAGNKLLGKAVRAAADEDATVRVRMTQ